MKLILKIVSWTVSLLNVNQAGTIKVKTGVALCIFAQNTKYGRNAVSMKNENREMDIISIVLQGIFTAVIFHICNVKIFSICELLVFHVQRLEISVCRKKFLELNALGENL